MERKPLEKQMDNRRIFMTSHMTLSVRPLFPLWGEVSYFFVVFFTMHLMSNNKYFLEGTCIVFLFMFQITFFNACLAWSGEHEKDGRSGLTLTKVTGNGDVYKGCLCFKFGEYQVLNIFVKVIWFSIVPFFKVNFFRIKVFTFVRT